MNPTILFSVVTVGLVCLFGLLFFGFGQETKNTPSPIQNPPPPPPKPDPVPESAPEPQLSCFVKGIIRSMETEPEKWKEDYRKWTHQPTGLIVFYDERILPNWATLILYENTSEEKIALRKAVIKYLWRYRDDAVDKANAPVIRYFDSLGCPQEKTEGSV